MTTLKFEYELVIEQQHSIELEHSMSGSDEHLAKFFFQQVNADDAGQYTIAGLHDLDEGWMSEVKSLKLLPPEVTCPLLLLIQSSHFR